MREISDLATKGVIALSALLVLWILVGRQLNRRRGEELIRWMRKGLPVPGDQISVKWIGRSGFQMRVAATGKAVQGESLPFRWLELTVVLEPRDVLLLWLFNRLRGKRDLLVLRGDLRSKPRVELELVKGGSRLGRQILSGLSGSWVQEERDDGWMLAHRGKQASRLVHSLAPLWPAYAPHLQRLSVRKQAPHFLASFSLAGLEGMEAEKFFSLWRGIAEAALVRKKP